MKYLGKHASQDETHAFSLQNPYQSKNLLGKGNEQSTEEAEETLRALTGIVGLDGHAHLHHAPAQDDNANGFDAGEDKVGKVIYNGQGIAVGQGGNSEKTHGENAGGKNTEQAADSGFGAVEIVFQD